MHEPGTHLYTLWRKRRRLRVRLAIVILVVICLGLWLKPHLFPARHSSSSATTGTSSTTLTKGTPDFTTFVPSGKTIDSYGGWTRISPSSAAAVYAYSDIISGTAIIVSEQQLPASFSNDTAGEIKKLQSDQGYVTQHTTTVDDLTVYIGVSNKSYQSTIFVKDSILVLVTSYRTINDSTLSDYIRSLQ